MPRKPLYAAAGAALIVGLVLGGAALGVDADARTQAIEAIVWLAGLVLGGHTLTDIVSSRARRVDD